ncbi:MAG: DEAD/DEAH box helicase [Terrimicrobiaceae bacterium]
MELTEKFLVSLCGWPAFKEARAIHAAGRVSEATYAAPVLKGKVVSQGKPFLAGLKIRNAVDVENLCPCRDSRVRGIICAHAVAVGIAVLHPAEKKAPATATPVPARQNPTTEIPRIQLALEGSLRHLDAEISFGYSGPGVANREAEAAALRELISCGFVDFHGKAALKGEAAVLRFFSSTLPRLRNKWTVREGGRFRHVTRDIVRIEPRFALREKEDGWLDFHIHFTAGNEAVLPHREVQRLLQGGSPQLRLKGGRVAVPDADLAADIEEVLRDAAPLQERGIYRIPGSQRAYLEACISGWTGADGAAIQVAPLKPGRLKGLLRPYQIDGAGWLLFLAQKNSGGLLADEMGLGKTVQALAMMGSLPGPHMVVCPSSLVWNWRREAEKFVPGLKVLAIEGAEREGLFGAIPSSDIVVTSYALLRRDIGRYRGRPFSTLVLDEAQHIKNPDSQNAKAACALQAGARFILTGTPLENSLRDLWSLFDFLLPGYLGSRKDFQERYEKPLLEGGSGPLWDRLNRRVRPWMLRRKKSDLLPELPDKIEQVVEVELSPAQKAVYTQLQIAARAEADAMKESGGAARMRVLTALLRLRQACCDLRLLGRETPGDSAKLDALLELVGEAVDGGHRVLVFSQFTAMLDLIAPALDKAGFAWCRLDGSTKDRATAVEKFQSDPAIPVFLISLKAGGTGLNLTAADTVIHFDPWWNPAAEAQATDRAHRIGQTRVVTSIKLIARDTVEHRVIAMQEKKRALISGLLDAEMPALTSEDWRELLA